MKPTTMLAALGLIASTLFACNGSTDGETAGAESRMVTNNESASDPAALLGRVAIRQVLDKQMLPNDPEQAPTHYARLRAILEGSGALTGSGLYGVSMGKVQCEPTLGTDECTIEIFDQDDPKTNEAEETLWQLRVHIFQGTVTFASMDLLAG